MVLRDVTRAHPGRVVLDGIDLRVSYGERVCVVGENGSGKSTLLRVIAGVDAPDGGEALVHAVGGVGYLSQLTELPPETTVAATIDDALAELRDLAAAMRAAEAAMAEPDLDPDALTRLLDAYGALTDAFEARDGYGADARLDAALHGLGLAGLDRDRVLDSLSGGEQARLRLACVLTASPELLLLDEPTNHLDEPSLTWLEERLRTHRGTVVVVTHDRVFLERVATTLVEVDADRHTLTRHGDGWAGYRRARAAARARWEDAYRDWAAELGRQHGLAEVGAAALAGATGRSEAGKDGQRHQRSVSRQLSSRVRNANERLRRLDADAVPRPPEPLRFSVHLGTDEPVVAGPVAALRDVVVGDRLRIDALTIARGERLLVTGRNGAGKSTLLRVLAGNLAPDRGEVDRPGHIAWLPQEVVVTAPSRTVLAEFGRGLGGDQDERRERLLGLGLFHADDLALPIGALSAGQRRRLALARLVVRRSDLMLLDEPTNHLSPGLAEEVEQALTSYAGALVVVSHDRMLRARFAGRVCELSGGRLTA